MNQRYTIDKPWAQDPQEASEAFEVAVDEGLDSSAVEKRRETYGRNQLRSSETRSTWQIWVEQFKSLIVLLLSVASLLSFAFGDLVEGLAIVAVILINALIGFITELRAVRSMEALEDLGSVETKVRREGHTRVVSAEALVPGDVVILSSGDVVTADLRLTEASRLQTNESALTGESVPVDKQVEPVDGSTPLAERASMAYKGTAVTRGAGEGVVIATGMDTELGQISSLVEEAEEEVTPLEERLRQLSRNLIWVTLGIAAVVIATGIAAGKETLLMIETGIALAVASVPEGLPIVATVALARGMWRMAQRNALIAQLSAVETLGSTSIIMTDKTGTLTENQMTVKEMALAFGEVRVSGEGLDLEGEFTLEGDPIDPTEDSLLHRALEIGVLCSDATLERDASNDGDVTAVGDPLEVALLVAGAKVGLERKTLLEEKPEIREEAFDAELKMMATYHEEDDRYRVAVKGAYESVAEVSTTIRTRDGNEPLSDAARDEWRKKNEQMAEDGLRVIALATKRVDSTEAEPYEELTFLGLVGLLDPPREDVRPSIKLAQDAGVRVVMVTGDQAPTAINVAKAVGLATDEEPTAIHGRDLTSIEELSAEERERILASPIFARVSPEQKLNLIAAQQDEGAIVAMTGDGVNDAPALKKADIGVAMGQRGTQVAREAADMVLKDDAFSTIVVAIEQGRAIFNNIRQFVLYLLSCNVAEVMIVALASLVNAPLPILPLQILFLNLVTDVFPALALGVGEGDPTLMNRPPRDPDESIMTRRHWGSVAGYGTIITFSVLGAFALAFRRFQFGQDRAVSISFLSLAFAQLWHVFNMRESAAGLVRNEVTQNPYVWGALALCTGLLLGAVYIPAAASLLNVSPPGSTGWTLIIVTSLTPLIVGQIVKEGKKHFGRTDR